MKNLFLFAMVIFLTILPTAIAANLPPPPPFNPMGGSNQAIPENLTTNQSNQSANVSNTHLNETCSDYRKNQDESDIDCGGNCNECAIGKICQFDSDCTTLFCNPTSLRCEIVSQQTNGDGSIPEETVQLPVQQSMPAYNPQANPQPSQLKSEGMATTLPGEEQPKEKIQSNTWMFYGFIINSILILLLCITVVVQGVKIASLKSKLPSEDARLPKLKEYVANLRKKGYADDIIRKALEQSNWPRELLDKMF